MVFANIYFIILIMSKLTLQEKINLVLEETEKHGITAYEIGNNTELDSSAVHRILTKAVKKPRERTLNIILAYIEKKIVGTNLIAEEEKPHYPKKAEKYSNGVPFFNVDFSSGYEAFLNDQNGHPDFFIDYEPYNNADFWVCNVGNSMSPKIENGDIVALKAKSDFTQMIYGEIYAIVMPEMRTIKYIRKSTKPDHVLFVPENKQDYDPQDMPIELIEKFFLVLGSIKKFF